MPIDTVHPKYQDQTTKWAHARDANDGQAAVKARTTEHLPQLEGQDAAEYKAYLQRAVFFNATGRTVEGMTGLVNRKAPVVELPSQIEGMEEDATEDGQSLSEVAKHATEGLLISGRLGFLVDRSKQDNSDLYLTGYSAEEITNWREDDDGNLTLIVLKEGYYEADPSDPYTLTAKIRYRELTLLADVDEAGQATGTASYHQRLWKRDNNNNWQIVEDLVPLKAGQPLDRIPFVPVNPKGVGLDVWDPPILDIAEMNLAHYRNSADIEHGRHLTALPTPWVSGVDEGKTGAELPLGSGKAWRLPEGAQVGFLEFSGVGIATLQTGMEEKEAKMAALGARMIEPPRSGVEAAETARIHQAGSNATLADIAGAVGMGLEAALELAAEWEGATADSVSVEMNKDFVDARLTPQEIQALVDAYLKGAISQETLLHNLKVGEILPEDRTVEDEMKALEAAQPDASNDGGAGEASTQDGGDAFNVERDDSGNVVRLVRG